MHLVYILYVFIFILPFFFCVQLLCVVMFMYICIYLFSQFVPFLSSFPLIISPPLGSHDSFTFWVDVHAPVGPDQKAFVQYLATMFSVLAKKVMVKWSMTQVMSSDDIQHDIFQQSLHGF